MRASRRGVLMLAAVVLCGGNLAYALPDSHRTVAISSAEPLSPGAAVLRVVGRVEIRQAPAAQWKRATAGSLVDLGGFLRTVGSGRANLRLHDGSVIHVGPRSEVRLQPLADARGRNLLLSTGALWIRAHPQRTESLHVTTPCTVLAVRGTLFSAGVGERGQTTATVIEGRVSVTAGEQRALLFPGQCATVRPTADPTLRVSELGTREAAQWQHPALLGLLREEGVPMTALWERARSLQQARRAATSHPILTVHSAKPGEDAVLLAPRIPGLSWSPGPTPMRLAPETAADPGVLMPTLADSTCVTPAGTHNAPLP